MRMNNQILCCFTKNKNMKFVASILVPLSNNSHLLINLSILLKIHYTISVH